MERYGTLAHDWVVRELPTGTVTFLFTDIEGSTRLLEELGERYVEALAEHRRVVREACARHGGVEVDTQGDAFFVAFREPREAVRAAGEAQAELGSGPVRVRMGVHTGEPIVWAEGYAGVDVHRGARICAAAHGGQVVVSERTAALLDGAQLRPLGAHRLKDLSAPQPLFQLGEGEFPPLRTLHATNLPAQPGALIGRERELAETTNLLGERARLLTLTGAGGSGKTRLALQIAADVAEDFPDGVFWVPLAAVSEAELVLPTVAGTIGAKNGVSDYIDTKRMLLLLDNFEQVVGAAAEVGVLLERCPNLKLLVTSREVLRLSGEWEYEVEPLPENEAVSLFAERARAIVPTFEPDESVAEICRRLDGLPLAIELAAARVRILQPQELLARLDQRLPLLTGGRRDAPERQQTLRATVEWSYDLLEPAEALLFARLAIFAGSFDLEAAGVVCEASLDVVERLVEQSLVRRWASGRLGMLETIRELGLERLAQGGEGDEVAQAHFEYFLSLAEAAEVRGEAYTTESLERLDAERDNFRAALRWALDGGQPVLALQLASALGRLWVIRAHQEGFAWVSEALEAAPDAPADLRASGLMWAGSTVFFTGAYDQAKVYFEEALDLFRQVGDRLNVARMLDRLAAPYALAGDHAKARELAEESLALHRELGDGPGSLYPLSKIAADEWRRGDRELAVTMTEETLELARESGDSWWEAGALGELSDMALQQGDLDRAGTFGRQCLSLAHELGNTPTVVYAFALLAVIAAVAGDTQRAGRLWGAVDAIGTSGEAQLHPEDRERYEAAIHLVPDAELEAAREEGRAMTRDEAAELALA
jgi:predicted ATPase/class 3 adenylate cyclase